MWVWLDKDDCPDREREREIKKKNASQSVGMKSGHTRCYGIQKV